MLNKGPIMWVAICLIVCAVVTFAIYKMLSSPRRAEVQTATTPDADRNMDRVQSPGQKEVSGQGLRISRRQMENDPGTSVLSLVGTLNERSTPFLEKAIQEAVSEKADGLILSCERAELASTDACRYLISLADQLTSQNKKLALARVQDEIVGVVKMLHMDQMIPMFPTEDDAAAWIRSGKGLPERIDISGIVPILTIQTEHGYLLPGLFIDGPRFPRNTRVTKPFGGWVVLYAYREQLGPGGARRYLYTVERHLDLMQIQVVRLHEEALKNLLGWYRSAEIALDKVSTGKRAGASGGPFVRIRLPDERVALSVLLLPEFRARVQDILGSEPIFVIPSRSTVLALRADHFSESTPSPQDAVSEIWNATEEDERVSSTFFSVTTDGAVKYDRRP